MAPVEVAGCGISVTVLVGSANVGKGISGLRVRVKLVVAVAVAVAVAVSTGRLVGVLVLVNWKEISGDGEIVAVIVGESIITGVAVHPHSRRTRKINGNLQRDINVHGWRFNKTVDHKS